MNETPIRLLELHTPREIRAELERVGADSSLEEKVARAQFFFVKLERVSLPLARLLFQELTMEGGQVVTAPRLDHVGAGETDVLLCATRYQFNHLLVRLQWQPSEELQTLAVEMERVLEHAVSVPPAMDIGNKRFDWTRTFVMGILNVTPDSFSGDALIHAEDTEAEWVERVVARAGELVVEGADVLDIGGESTHPSATPVPLEIEMQRVLPAVRALKQAFSIPLSIDTTKAGVADAALDTGADMVNDVTGLRGDAEMKRVVAAHHVPVVIMHNWLWGERPAQVPDAPGVIIDELQTQIDTALGAGISERQLILDPGLGFGKTTEENLQLLYRLGELYAAGLPLLIGPSRKGFISKATGVAVDERDAGTAAAISIGILRGANMIRVHDVKTMVRAARMADAIKFQQTRRDD